VTAAAFQSFGISDDTKERLNRLVKGVATILADNFRKKGSRLSSPADLHLHLHLSHLADALIQSDLQIGAFTL
jgi:hypothetical protein